MELDKQLEHYAMAILNLPALFNYAGLLEDWTSSTSR